MREKILWRKNINISLPEGDEGQNFLEHIEGGLVDSEESSVVELSESEESQNSLDFRVKLVDTIFF